jgi:hypothetical protein
MGYGFATLGEEQERKLAPEVEEAQKVERPREMEAETHVLYPELVRLTSLGYVNGHSTALESAFKALRCTSSARLSIRLDSTAILSHISAHQRRFRVHHHGPPGSSRATFISDCSICCDRSKLGTYKD